MYLYTYKVTKLVRVLVMWLRVTCAIAICLLNSMKSTGQR